MSERMLSFIGSSASIPADNPKFLNSCHTQFSKISPIAKATNILYIVSAAGKYRRKVFILQPNAPKTDVLIKSSPCMTCSAIHSTIPSNMPTASLPSCIGYAVYPFHLPSVKKGVMYAMMKPKPFKIAQVITIRLSQDRDSSTVLPLLEKFINSNAIAAVTTAAIVEIRRIWLYTSFIISVAFCQTVGAAKTCVLKQVIILMHKKPTYR